MVEVVDTFVSVGIAAIGLTQRLVFYTSAHYGRWDFAAGNGGEY